MRKDNILMGLMNVISLDDNCVSLFEYRETFYQNVSTRIFH